MKTDFVKKFQDRMQESRDAIFFVSKEGEAFTFASFWANAEGIAEQWKRDGVKPGAVVAIQLPNSAALLCCYLACAIGGFVACPILDSHHPDMQKKLLSLVKPAHLVLKAPELNLKLQAIEFLLATPADQHFLLTFSSGLTGDPKTIVHSLHNILGSASSFARLTGLSSDSTIYHILPMAYMAGILNTFFAPLMAGSKIVEGPLFSPLSMTDFFTRPIQYGVSVLSLTPTIAAALCRLGERATTFSQTKENVLRTLKQVQCTSAPIPLRLYTQFFDLFSLPLQNCYGMTEIGGPLTFQSREDAIALSPFSEPVAELEICLQNSNELWLRSPYLMCGYLLENGTLEAPFDEEGYMNTGDTAILENGRLQITGRKKEIIIRGGVNISPLRIESILSLAPRVEEIAVIGHPHPFWGEVIVACVVGRQGASVSEAEIKIYAREHLGVHERPDFIFVLDSLPRTNIGKIQKSILKEKVKNLLPESVRE